MKPTLYHYTCAHHAPEIATAGKVLPGFMLTDKPMPWTGRIAWFTDLIPPNRFALGLTSYRLKCDRTEARFRVVDPTEVMPWWEYARAVPRELRDEIEGGPGVRPAHWWVSVCGVPVVADAETEQR